MSRRRKTHDDLLTARVEVQHALVALRRLARRGGGVPAPEYSKVIAWCRDLDRIRAEIADADDDVVLR